MTCRMQYIVGLIAVLVLTGCAEPVPIWGVEHAPLFLPGHKRQVWAVAPVVNLSGQHAADPILQADLVFQELQQVEGVTVIPVNRTVEVLLSLRIEKVASEEQAAIVCGLLGCDGLVVPTITIPSVPSPICQSMRFLSRAKSSAPSGSIGVTIATKLPVNIDT